MATDVGRYPDLAQIGRAAAHLVKKNSLQKNNSLEQVFRHTSHAAQERFESPINASAHVEQPRSAQRPKKRRKHPSAVLYVMTRWTSLIKRLCRWAVQVGSRTHVRSPDAPPALPLDQQGPRCHYVQHGAWISCVFYSVLRCPLPLEVHPPL